MDLHTSNPRDNQKSVDDQHLMAHGCPPATSDKSSGSSIALSGDLQLKADPADAITTAETAVSTANADVGRPLSDADSSQVRRGESQSVSPLEQATQLSDKARTDVRLAGGQNSPRPPDETKTRKDNKISFRTEDEMYERISSYADSAGLTLSEAARILIEAALGQPRIVITPKAPAPDLEFFAKQIKAWIKCIMPIRYRLNAPMPEPDDDELADLVKGWRAMSSKLLQELPALLESARAQRNLLTSLNAESIGEMRALYLRSKSWIQACAEKKKTFSDPTSRDAKKNDANIMSYQTLGKLIENLGILKGVE